MRTYVCLYSTMSRTSVNIEFANTNQIWTVAAEKTNGKCPSRSFKASA